MHSSDFLKKKQSLFRRYFHFLNPEQQEAVFQITGPLLVLAGAGSGKTTVLVNRIANIILFGNAFHSDRIPDNEDELYREMTAFSGDEHALKQLLQRLADRPAPPYRVLCITFTNKAANEFKERLNRLLGEQAADIWAGTFHSICVRILRRHIHLLGYTNSFSIYDEDDKKKLLTAIMKDLRIDEHLLSVKNVIQLISQQKERGNGPEEMAESAGRDIRVAMASRVYRRYREDMRKANALDFDDLIFYTSELFQKHPDVLKTYQDLFDYILVDEFQDTNPSQNDLVVLLAGRKQNVCVVGDDDQSIYSFRGATVENILQFDRTFPNAKIIRLEQNYRSTSHILNAANAVIANNEGRKGKNLWTNAGDGDPVVVERPISQLEEAGFIVSEIQSAVKSGKRSYKDFAVLYRVTALSNTLEQALVRNRIPYRICGGLRFNERREIKDVIAYLSVIHNPSDPIRLTRILNVPKRAIGDTTLARIASIAASEGISYFEVIEHAVRYPDLSKSAVKLIRFAELIHSLQAYVPGHTVEQLVRKTLDDTGYLQYLRDEAKADGDDQNEREQNVLEFLSTAKLYDETAETPTLAEFLEETALVSDTDVLEDAQDSVTLMTVHSAKGLEYPVVFIAGFEEELFPYGKAVYEGNLEEERRLAYVAITRAKEKLYITHCASRMLYGYTNQNVPSRFLKEIPAKDKTELRKQMRTGTPQSGFDRPSYDRNRTGSGVPQYRNETAQSGFSACGTYSFGPGDRVQHPFFGPGEVLTAESMGGDILYEIRFDSGSEKRLMGSFAKLKPASD